MFCGACGVAPYCSGKCQRTDWSRRHKAVCHNLARLSEGHDRVANALPKSNDTVSAISAPAPQHFRRPMSPGKSAGREQPRDRDEDAKSSVRPDQRNEINGYADKKVARKSTRGRLMSPKVNNMRRPRLDQNHVQVTPEEVPPAANKQEPAPAVTKHEAHVSPPTYQKPRSTPAPSTDSNSAAVQPRSAALPEVEKPLVPKDYLMSRLSVGDTALLSVEGAGGGGAGAGAGAGAGLVCVCVHESLEAEYGTLCDAFCASCDLDTALYTPSPGDTFAYRSTEDGAWYRARCLHAGAAALLDAGRTAPLTPPLDAGRTAPLAPPQCRALRPDYARIPEFTCVLTSQKAKIGDNLKATIESVSGDVVRVKLHSVEGDEMIGEGEITRWTPKVEYSTAPVTTAAVVIPEIARPRVTNKSNVVIVEAGKSDGIYVRSSAVEATKKYNAILQDVLLYGMEAAPLKEPPLKGDIVVAKFTDGNHYRALVKRTNLKQNKYLLEYVDFGNVEISQLENLYPCPEGMKLEKHPTVATLVKLQGGRYTFTEEAKGYVDKLRDDEVELVLTLPNGADAAESGCDVLLSVENSNESVNRRLTEMCSPEWKRMEMSGEDVVTLEPLMFNDLERMPLPAAGCELDVLDFSTIAEGVVAACPRGDKHANYVFNELSDKMAEYCNSALGKEPYLPKAEELCIAQCPPYPQWLRAVLCEQVAGPGGSTAHLCFVDYGNMEKVPVALIRKMLPEFVRRLPAVASHVQLRGFPEELSLDGQKRALEYLRINDEGRGVLAVTNCEKLDAGFYTADAPGLLAAILK